MRCLRASRWNPSLSERCQVLTPSPEHGRMAQTIEQLMRKLLEAGVEDI